MMARQSVAHRAKGIAHALRGLGIAVGNVRGPGKGEGAGRGPEGPGERRGAAGGTPPGVFNPQRPDSSGCIRSQKMRPYSEPTPAIYPRDPGGHRRWAPATRSANDAE